MQRKPRDDAGRFPARGPLANQSLLAGKMKKKSIH